MTEKKFEFINNLTVVDNFFVPFIYSIEHKNENFYFLSFLEKYVYLSSCKISGIRLVE